MRSDIMVALLIAGSASTLGAQLPDPAPYLEGVMQRQHIPAIAIAVTRGGQIVARHWPLC